MCQLVKKLEKTLINFHHNANAIFFVYFSTTFLFINFSQNLAKRKQKLLAIVEEKFGRYTRDIDDLELVNNKHNFPISVQLTAFKY
jgi:hypothetical protein